MIPIPIKHRETDEYALNQPDLLRVRIADGQIAVDHREHFFGIHAIDRKEAISRGIRKN